MDGRHAVGARVRATSSPVFMAATIAAIARANHHLDPWVLLASS